MISKPNPSKPMEVYTYGSVSSFDNRVFLQDYANKETGEDHTARVMVQVDESGVYIEYTEQGIGASDTKEWKEWVSIPATDLGVAVAEYILEQTQTPRPSLVPEDAKKLINERLDFLETYLPPSWVRSNTINEIRELVGK